MCFGAGAVGALLTVGILAAAGVFDQQSSPGSSTAAGSPQPTDNIAEVAARVAPAIVAVRVTTKDGTRTGSGVCIRHGGQVFTSYRLVAGSQSVAIVTAHGTSRVARVVGARSVE